MFEHDDVVIGGGYSGEVRWIQLPDPVRMAMPIPAWSESRILLSNRDENDLFVYPLPHKEMEDDYMLLYLPSQYRDETCDLPHIK